MSAPRLRRVRPADVVAARVEPLDADTRRIARSILDDVRDRGELAVIEHATRLGDLEDGAAWRIPRETCEEALARLSPDVRGVLERVAARIRAFADAQRASLRAFETPIPGGVAGQDVAPVEAAGCYAPGGRYPLPSSLLMTAVTARAAGVERVVAASPRPSPIVLATAAVADVDELLAVGGAQAIGAFAFGVDGLAPCDVIAGPGNRYVTAAKELVAGRVTIDLPAGPSELVVVADASADPDWVAADLLAQAEHDPDALPILVAWEESVVEAVDRAVESRLASLPTREVAEAALRNGMAVLAADADEAAEVCDRLAPEHLQISTRDAASWRSRLRHYGGLFLGETSAEVFGDYGIGPNHVLPTGSYARRRGGLSVLTFLRQRTWMKLDEVPSDVLEDSIALARLEGLEAHARAAEARRADGLRRTDASP